ncbi:class I adenylate-forming enzyme family protein [Bosea sp. CS1GBMeth4]|uniref:class I adenylate-forming enzyme family protein n=1 Tax=Bosea sp. CS1GBMeth4 TaxID=1892849 RepID=UPI0016458896|nr:class I adenylate-forming enzyme family protein [Bosea sp. CS1GBMeth4]
MTHRIGAAQLAAERARIERLEAGALTTTIGAFCRKRAAALGARPFLDVFERGERATYAQTEQTSNLIANGLASLGIGKGDRVAVMLPNRILYPLLFLALAKLGAIHVPVNTRYTPREIAYVTGDSGAAALIVDPAHLETLAAVEERDRLPPAARTLVPDGKARAGMVDFDALVAGASDAPPRDPGIAPDDLMNIQYTSGTTGFPKGCMLSHDYWMVLAQSAAWWDAEPVSRLLTAQPFFYMDPQWHLLKTMVLGGTLFMAPQLSSSRFIGWVKRYGIEWCQFPILMTRQPEAPDDGATALKQVASFGWDGETCRAFKRRFGVRAREGFGMTEIGLGTLMPPGFEAMFDSGSVGIDGPFRQTTIRDEAGRAVPPGRRGELWVRGRGLLQGYWNRPGADAEAFRPADDGGPRWFRTGDLFEADEDGFLWLVGRLKDMIRRSSENIAAREVEAVIRELPQVEDCAAVPVPDAKRGEEVKIYVQLKPGITPAELPPEAILAHARAGLAAFKVPRFYAYVESFPRTVSNKIEKRNLVAGVADLRADAWDAEAQHPPG